MKTAFSTTLASAIALIILLTFSTPDILAVESDIEIEELTADLYHVWEITWGPDDYLWITERPGRVQRINPEDGSKELILDISDQIQTGSERGLMGMALSPNFLNDKYVFLSYTYLVNQITKVKVVRYKYENDKLIESIVVIENIDGANYHDGCRIKFGDDGKLYITTGDATKDVNAQDRTSLNGKILRLNPDGTIPEDNPFYGNKSIRNEIWTLGHRNPQGLVFHNGILYSSEHGPNTNDELNLIEKGRNYGWPNVEGFCDKTEEMDFCKENDVREPLAVYNLNSTLAVAGIDYYDVSTDAKYYNPKWQNSIFMATLKTGLLKQIQMSNDGTKVVSDDINLIINEYGRLRSVCVAPDGRIFVGTSGGTDKILVIKGVSTTSVESKDKGSLFEVFPNPSYGYLNIKSASNSLSKVSIFDMLGNKITDIALDPNSSHNLLTSDMVSGQYQLRIESNGQIENKIVNIIR